MSPDFFFLLMEADAGERAEKPPKPRGAQAKTGKSRRLL